MNRLSRLFAAGAVFSLATPAAFAATLLHTGRLIDSVGDKPRLAVTVVVEGDRIQAVEDGYRKPGPADTVIDLKDCTLTAGWWDMHVHITSEYNAGSALRGLGVGKACCSPRSRARQSALTGQRPQSGARRTHKVAPRSMMACV